MKLHQYISAVANAAVDAARITSDSNRERFGQYFDFDGKPRTWLLEKDGRPIAVPAVCLATLEPVTLDAINFRFKQKFTLQEYLDVVDIATSAVTDEATSEKVEMDIEVRMSRREVPEGLALVIEALNATLADRLHLRVVDEDANVDP